MAVTRGYTTMNDDITPNEARALLRILSEVRIVDLPLEDCVDVRNAYLKLKAYVNAT